MLAPDSNPEEAFTDNHDPEYPGIETCRYCLFCDEHSSAGVGSMSAVSQPGVNKGSSFSAGAMPAPSTVSHETESNLSQREEVSARSVSGSGEDLKIQVPASQVDISGPSSFTCPPPCP